MYLTAVIQTIHLDHNPIRMQIENGRQKMEASVIYLVFATVARGRGFSTRRSGGLTTGDLDYAMITDVSSR